MSPQSRVQLYAAIRRDAREGLSGRASTAGTNPTTVPDPVGLLPAVRDAPRPLAALAMVQPRRSLNR